MFKDWVIDASMSRDGFICFVPYEDDTLWTGMNVLSTKCPGHLVGVIHEEGKEAAEEWIEKHPNWAEEYKKEGE